MPKIEPHFSRWRGESLKSGLSSVRVSFSLRGRPSSTSRHTMYAQQQLAYAPTPYSYTPSSNLTATINLDEVPHVLLPKLEAC